MMLAWLLLQRHLSQRHDAVVLGSEAGRCWRRWVYLPPLPRCRRPGRADLTGQAPLLGTSLNVWLATVPARAAGPVRYPLQAHQPR